jgi:hypothetical protein
MKINKIIAINLVILLFWIFLFKDGKIAENKEFFVLFFLYTILIFIDYYKNINYLKHILIIFIIGLELFVIKSFLVQGIDVNEFILITLSVISVLVYYVLTILRGKRIYPNN